MHRNRRFTGSDAIRLLCHAVHKTHHIDRFNVDFLPECRNSGEVVLLDALHHLAHGDTVNAKVAIRAFEQWRRTGETAYPYYLFDRDDDDDGIPF